jgi:hypothetical protein
LLVRISPESWQVVFLSVEQNKDSWFGVREKGIVAGQSLSLHARMKSPQVKYD